MPKNPSWREIRMTSDERAEILALLAKIEKDLVTLQTKNDEALASLTRSSSGGSN
jgi:hypothetical protein